MSKVIEKEEAKLATVRLVNKDKEFIVVNEIDVETYKKDGWKAAPAEQAAAG